MTGIEELERRGILRSSRSADGAATYDFAHDLIRQAAYLKTSEARRRLLHLEIARALSRVPDKAGDLAADVAHHAALGGDDELCVRACITAGQRCIRMFANAEAQALANRGRQRLDHLDRTIRIPLHMTLLRLSVESGTWRTCARELEGELSRTVLEAQSAGLAAEVANGWELLSEMHEEEGHYARAQASLAMSEEIARSRSGNEDPHPGPRWPMSGADRARAPESQGDARKSGAPFGSHEPGGARHSHGSRVGEALGRRLRLGRESCWSKDGSRRPRSTITGSPSRVSAAW